MQDDVYQAMFDVEDRHWWYVAKQRIVLNLLDRYLTPHNGSRPRVADLGCGCGAMLSRMSDRFDAVGMDGSPHAIEFCAKRGVKAELGAFGAEGITLAKKQFDAVLMLDVLEHLEDDFGAVKQAAELLKPGGIMVCTVPAYMWLWSYWDTLHHHYRRYARPQFRKLFEAVPELKLELLSYANTSLFPLAASVRMVQRVIKPKNEKHAIELPPAPVNWVLKTVYSTERHTLGRLPMPFGLSVVAVARKSN